MCIRTPELFVCLFVKSPKSTAFPCVEMKHNPLRNIIEVFGDIHHPKTPLVEDDAAPPALLLCSVNHQN